MTDSGSECSLSKFVDDTEMSGAADLLEGQEVTQRDLDKLEEWAFVNLTKFNKANSKVLHLGQSPVEYMLRNEGIESSPEERDLAVLVDEKIKHELAMRACSLESQPHPRCIKSSMASRSREGILPLCSGETCIQLWSPQHRKDMDLLEWVQRRATKMIWGLEHLSYEERLRELGLFSLENRRLRGDLRAACQRLKGAFKKAGEGLFTKGMWLQDKGQWL